MKPLEAAHFKAVLNLRDKSRTLPELDGMLATWIGTDEGSVFFDFVQKNYGIVNMRLVFRKMLEMANYWEMTQKTDADDKLASVQSVARLEREPVCRCQSVSYGGEHDRDCQWIQWKRQKA